MHRLRVACAPYWQSIQHTLFPPLERVLGPLTEKQQQLVQALEVIRIEQMIPRRFRVPGRPPKDRAAMARAFVAKAVYDMPTTRVLLAATRRWRRNCEPKPGACSVSDFSFPSRFATTSVRRVSASMADSRTSSAVAMSGSVAPRK